MKDKTRANEAIFDQPARIHGEARAEWRAELCRCQEVGLVGVVTELAGVVDRHRVGEEGASAVR